jgi:hypothetical protein
MLEETCKKERLEFVPPYNTGVFILNHGLQVNLANACKEFLRYAWRLLLGIRQNEELTRECALSLRLREVELCMKGSNTRAPLCYPSSNWWILEEIATLFTLGGVRGLTHGALLRSDVLQNGEYNDSVLSSCPTLAHYFSNLEHDFFERVKRL